MTNITQIKKIAVACQGNGSHTAFAAGVLKRILQEKEKEFEIIALSGTSGGAVCAVLTWYGLLTEGREKAIASLEGFWQDNSVSDSLQEKWLNEFFVCSVRMRDYVSLPELMPNVWSDFFQDRLRKMVEKYVNFEKISWLLNRSSITLLVGAVNMMTSEFKVFRNNEITPEAILASAAVPTLFKPVRIGRNLYWDGLISENPPIRGLAKEKPDEIWVIQVSPSVIDEPPSTMEAIRERRNELTANLSLEQEVYFIEKINSMLQKKILTDDSYKYIKVRKIQMRRQLNYATKLDRSPGFIKEMMAYGEEEADKFFMRS